VPNVLPTFSPICLARAFIRARIERPILTVGLCFASMIFARMFLHGQEAVNPLSGHSEGGANAAHL
jgi:hypothetical protein